MSIPQTTLPFSTPGAPEDPSSSVTVDDVLDEVYGRDLDWADGDFVETAEGDLQDVGGPDNVHRAIEDRLLSEGLPWDPSYGAHPREYVDGSGLVVPALRATVVRQVLSDDRVRDVTVTLSPPTSDVPDEATIDVGGTLVGGQPINLSTSLPVS